MSSNHPSIFRRLPGVPSFFAASSVVSPPQERDRNKISDEYKWDLSAIYPSDEAWRAEKDILASELPQLRSFQGSLSSSAATLADALELQSRFEKELEFRSGYPRQYISGDGAADDSTGVCAWDRGRLHRA
jgi:oligoendopeptidase F